jgi:GntR family transcriptional repressor for pyruvate dehydrogenase complex
VRLAQASHNRAIALIVQSLREPILMSLEKARETTSGTETRSIHEHRQLVEAVRRRDPELVEHIMTTHLNRTLGRVTTQTDTS